MTPFTTRRLIHAYTHTHLLTSSDLKVDKLDTQVRTYGKPNGHAQKAVTVQRGKIVGTQNTSVCSENMNSVFFYWLFSIQSYKISQGSYAWVHNDICIVKERKMCT